MGSKLLTLRSSLWMYLVRKTFHFNGVIIKTKNSECFQKNVGFLFFIEKLRDLEAMVSLLALIQSLIQQY